MISSALITFLLFAVFLVGAAYFGYSFLKRRGLTGPGVI